MSTSALAAYIPEDRRRALANGGDLPARAPGSMLFVDISGFTPLTETLARSLGNKRGAEALTRLLNEVYTALIAGVEAYGGSVIGFSGDAITCWFAADGDQAQAARRALAAAFDAQASMAAFAQTEAAPGVRASLAVKCAVATGETVRCVVGDPAIQRIDVVAGRAVERMALAEQAATRGTCHADEATVLAAALQPAEWQEIEGSRIARIESVPEVSPFPPAADALPGSAEEWVHPALIEAIAAGRERFLAELRPAVALFVRFTGLDFEADPDAPNKLDCYVRWVQQVLRRYGGVLIQLTTGDKGSYLYAAFGAPIAHDDDSQRACAAALELRSPSQSLAFVMQTQIGISQGLMRVGAYGSPRRRTYGVLGDEANLAARLMMRAAGGQVLATRAIVESAGSVVRSRSAGVARLKGKSAGVPVFVIEGLEHPSQAERFALLYASPPVGRQRELEMARAALDRIAGGSGATLLLEGPAGIGKSHLLGAIVREGGGRGLRVALTASHSTTQQSPYAALGMLLSTLLRLPDEIEGEERTSLLRRELLAIDARWQERLPLLREPLRLSIEDSPLTRGLDARLRQLALTTLVIDIVEAAAARQPCLIAVEDAHWMDEASQQVLLALLQAAGQWPLGFLLAARLVSPGESALLDEARLLDSTTAMAVAELTAEGSAALAAARLGGEVQPLAAALLHARAQGNPFFTEELIDALRDAGRLRRTEEVWELSDETRAALRRAGCLAGDEDEPRLRTDAPLADVDLGVPDSVQGVVLSRLDRLPENARLALKVASVIGQSFALPLLQSVRALEGMAGDVAGFVDQALQRDFVRVEQPQEQLYLFKHNITREVAYSTLLEEQQHELHQSVAEAIEHAQPDAMELLAHHYYRSDTRRPELRARALRYLSAAAARAATDYANDTALTHFARAFELDPAPRYLVGEVHALHALGRRDEQRRLLEELARRSDAEPFETALLWGDFAEATGDFDLAEERLGAALAEAQNDNQPLCSERQAQALARLGLVAWRRGDYGPAEERFAAALALLRERPASIEEADAYYGLGLVYRQTGRYEEARAALLSDLATSRQHGRRDREARALTQLGHVESIERQHARALGFYEQALAIRKSIGDRPGIGASLLAVAQAYEALGDYGGAEPLLIQALAIHQAVRNRFEETLVWNELGILYWLVGDYGRAQESLHAGLALSRSIESEFGEAYILCNLGQVLRDSGRPAEAVATLSAGLEIARAQEDANLAAIYAADLALAELQVGSLEDAAAHADEAERIFTQLALEASLAPVFATQALIALERRDTAAASEAAARALAILEGPSGADADFPHRDYWMCARVFGALGRGELERSCMQSAQRIVRDRAERISSAAMRSSYLHNVQANRAILEWFEPAGTPPPH